MKYGFYDVVKNLGNQYVLVICTLCNREYERRIDNLKKAGDKACCINCCAPGPKPTISIEYQGEAYSPLNFCRKFTPKWHPSTVRYHCKQGKTPEQIINAYNTSLRLRNRVRS